MINRDLVIIGGGSGGLAAAIQAKKEGVEDILILEKDRVLGGILNQCIHNGFGLTEFKEELSGPEYASRFIKEAQKLNIDYRTLAQVINLTKDKVVTYSHPKDGVVEVKAKAIIFATGCYERGAGAIFLPGDRPAGIITAGTAQKYLNIHGYLAGKRVVILGSGDIGLIMARRMTLEGAKVLCVSEIMPYSNGLNRNIAQCLTDFNIPLYLSRSVSNVIGKSRVEKVILSAVDSNMHFIPGSEMEFECDTLVLSIGLIPYTDLLSKIGVEISSTKGPKVNERLETSVPGIFACGNCLHVHDVVDFVSEEGRNAGHSAACYLKDKHTTNDYIKVLPGEGISYVVPQYIARDNKETLTFKFRVRKPVQNVNIVIGDINNPIAKIVKPVLIPSEMVMIKIDPSKLENYKEESLTLSLENR